jgi:hypothetical protein
MKIIGNLSGIVADREAVEEYLPEAPPGSQQLIELIRTTYEFQVYPRNAQAAQPVLNFAGGRFSSINQSFAISQLVMAPDGDIVQALTTAQAELVLDDVKRLLDETFGFRLRSAKSTRRFVSNMVVEFDQGLQDYIEAFAKIARTINSVRTGRPSFSIKRMSFGTMEAPQLGDIFAAIEFADFLIERRAGRPFEENRYFCSAPMADADHIRVLEQIEAIMRGEAD